MRRICYSVAMSLDGFIAGPQGENDWIVMDPEIDFSAIMERFDTVLMGRKTFEMARAQYGGGSMPGVEGIVVSSTLKPVEYPDVKIIGKNLDAELKQLRSQPCKDIWLFGGGALFRSLLEMGQVQTVEVALIPVLLGGGIPLLPTPAHRSKLKLIRSRSYPKTGTQSLEYELVPSPSRGEG